MVSAQITITFPDSQGDTQGRELYEHINRWRKIHGLSWRYFMLKGIAEVVAESSPALTLDIVNFLTRQTRRFSGIQSERELMLKEEVDEEIDWEALKAHDEALELEEEKKADAAQDAAL